MAWLSDDTARRYLRALEAARVPHFAGVVTINDHTAPHLLVRPGDEAAARRIAAEVEIPTVGNDGPGVLADDEAWFETPDLAPGPEESAAATRAAGGMWVAVIGALAASLGVFNVYDGALDASLPWIGSVAVVVGAGQWSRGRAQREQLRRQRERTPVGVTLPDEPRP